MCFDEVDDMLEVKFIDTGTGLTQRELSKLFQRFGKIEKQGVDAVAEDDGTGVGLATCKKIV